MTTNFGGVDVVPLLGEGEDQLWGVVPLRCDCGAPWWGQGRLRANFEGVDVVPLQGAIVVCYGLGGALRGCDDQLLGEWTWCHCRVPL